MALKQAKRIALYACVQKRPRTEIDAATQADLKQMEYYACPFSREVYHYHLTSGRNSRTDSTLRRAAEALGCLGPDGEEEEDG